MFILTFVRGITLTLDYKWVLRIRRKSPCSLSFLSSFVRRYIPTSFNYKINTNKTWIVLCKGTSRLHYCEPAVRYTSKLAVYRYNQMSFSSRGPCTLSSSSIAYQRPNRDVSEASLSGLGPQIATTMDRKCGEIFSMLC